jgi:hypothetical protein
VAKAIETSAAEEQLNALVKAEMQSPDDHQPSAC